MKNLIIIGYILTDKTPEKSVIISSHCLPSGVKPPKGLHCFLYGGKRILPSLKRVHLYAKSKALKFLRVDMTVPCRSNIAMVDTESVKDVDFIFTDLIKTSLRDELLEIFADTPEEKTEQKIGDILNLHPERVLRLWENPRFAHIKLFAAKLPLDHAESRQQYDQVAFLRSPDDITEIIIRGINAEKFDISFE